MPLIISSGQVAFITGGWYALTSVELYSPNGDCQHRLAPLPVDVTGHVLDKHGDTIIACAGAPAVDVIKLTTAIGIYAICNTMYASGSDTALYSTRWLSGHDLRP